MHRSTAAAPPRSRPFASFWQGGYEGADHYTHGGRLLDMNAANGHVGRAHADYQLLRQFGIDTVRESIGWRLVERDGVFDFSVLDERLLAARELGIQICWTFCHYGWPPEVDVYAPEFVTRFARFCGTAAAYLARFARPGDPAPVYSPMNEISFTSWGLSVHMFRCKNRDDPRAATEGKRQLVRAALAGCDAIWAVTPGARILHCDPLIHVIAPTGSPEWQAEADGASAAQYDAWDMLCGRREPELGGAPRYLDIIGANYYDTNQWESGTNARLWWHLGDARRKPLHRCLLDLHRRYHRPVLLAETSHVGSGRGAWIVEMAHQVALALQHGVAMQGICLYPIVDRNDWEHEHHWHRSGLWDLDRDGPDPLARQLVATYGAALQQGQRLITRLFEEIETGYHPQGHLRESIMDTVIVFCHLRWDFVYQRPQHLLTRLAQHYKVLFIEEPVFDEAAPHLRTYHPAPNVTVCQPHTPVPAPGFHDDQIPVLQSLLANLVPDGDDPVVWFYTPMALPLLAKLHPSLVVYDCMDELSAFKNPPRQLLQRESALLGIADLVFTGGPSLYEAKRPRHANVHCFPSSVDTVHFEQALDRSNAHPLHAGIPHPRLGFYGVIDERFDTALIAAMADAHPAWQIVLVGPVVKIAPEDLPQRPNIHYLGQQSYQALPQFLAGWDVCLLPFALNESTRYISPTKVLEYMAAELPIVSTAITDVEVPYGDVVAIGHDHAEFIAHCAAALQLTPALRATMAAHMRAVAARTSWDGTADQMQALIESTPANTSANTGANIAAQLPGNVAALAVGGNDAATAGQVPNYGESSKVNPLRAGAPVNETACLIIGGGPTGLSAAYHGDADTVLLERNATVGGWCRSIEDAGFTFDYAGHIMFSNDPYVLKLYDILLGDNQHWQMREAWVYSKQVFTRYPFQGALYGLPPDVIKECIVGAIDARYGVAEAPVCDAGTVEDCCADGTADVANAGGTARQERTQSFEEFIYKVWGSGIAKHFAIPYNKKLWTVPLAEMETSWLGGRVPLPDLGQIIDGALQPVARPMGPNARFGYPLKGGFQALVSGFLPHIKGKIELNADVVQVLPKEHAVALADGRRFHYDNLISTMPLPELVKLIGAEAPEEVRLAARGLRHISIRCVNIGIARENVTDKHWIYYPEDSIFHRIFVQGNASPECNAPGGFGFTCEISYSPWKPLPLDGDALIERCIDDCIAVGMMTEDDRVLVANQVDMPYAYVVYDHERAHNVAVVRDWMAQHDIVLAGRYSEWEYYNSDHAFLAGRTAAGKVRAASTGDSSMVQVAES